METKKEKEREQTEPYKTTCQAADWVLPDYKSILVRWMYGAIVALPRFVNLVVLAWLVQDYHCCP